MVRAFAIYLVIFCLFFFGIVAFREMAGKEKWELVKLLTYTAVCATLAFLVIVAFVIIF